MKNYYDLELTSSFEERINPITNEKEFHRGLDFKPNVKLEAFAGFTGVIRLNSRGEREGNFSQIFTLLNGVIFYVNIFHLEKFLIGQNKFVRPETVIAEAGSTGHSTGLHIHYEIFTYNAHHYFIQRLKESVKYYIIEKEKRIFFHPIELFEYCLKNNIYV